MSCTLSRLDIVGCPEHPEATRLEMELPLPEVGPLNCSFASDWTSAFLLNPQCAFSPSSAAAQTVGKDEYTCRSMTRPFTTAASDCRHSFARKLSRCEDVKHHHKLERRSQDKPVLTCKAHQAMSQSPEKRRCTGNEPQNAGASLSCKTTASLLHSIVCNVTSLHSATALKQQIYTVHNTVQDRVRGDWQKVWKCAGRTGSSMP